MSISVKSKMLNDLIKDLQNRGIVLSPDQLTLEMEYLDELLRWNKKVNLTAITDRDEVLEKHFYDCLFVASYIKKASSLVDIGSGAGMPGIPLAIMSPDLKVTSVESIGKKVNFQKHIKRKLHLDNLLIYGDRAEHLTREKARFDIVISRAFSSLQNFIEIGLPLLCDGGMLLAMKGPEGKTELSKYVEESSARDFSEIKSIDYTLPCSESARQLIVLKK